MDIDEIYYDTIDMLTAMVRIPSVSRDEDAVADCLETMMASLGHKPVRYGNNLLCTAPGFDESRPTVLLNAHIDTVKPTNAWTYPPFEPTYVDDRIYGLGTNDDGASVAALFGAFRFLADHHQSYNLLYLASCEEEVSGKNGIEMVIPHLPHIDVAIVGEPTNLQPAVAEKGLMVIDGEVKGVAGHAAREEGINAIYRATQVIDILRNLKFEKKSGHLGDVKISVTQINAGTQHNVVPDRCTFVADVRTTDAYSNQETLELIRKAIPDELECTLTPRSTRLNPSGIDLSHPLMQRLFTMGKEPFGSPTLSDQALMPWQSIKLGPGDSARSHTADEYITEMEVREALHTYCTLLDFAKIR